MLIVREMSRIPLTPLWDESTVNSGGVGSVPTDAGAVMDSVVPPSSIERTGAFPAAMMASGTSTNTKPFVSVSRSVLSPLELRMEISGIVAFGFAAAHGQG